MRRLRIALFAAAALAASSCISPEAYRNLEEANNRLRDQLADLRGQQEALDGENARLRGEVDRLGASAIQAAEFNKRKAELERLIAEFQQGGARAVPGVDVFRSAEGVVFRMQGEILFDSGQTLVTAGGQATLKQLLDALREHASKGKRIRIDGHTDSDPIKHSPWKTNWRLSAERAMAVLDYLGKNGIPADNLFIAAYGEHRPAVAGTDAAAKRANRRVEILMAD